MKLAGLEYSNTFYDGFPGGESNREPGDINEAYRIQFGSLMERTKGYPNLRTEGTSASDSETEHLVVGEHDGRPISLYFFIYTPGEHSEDHLPYNPSINAKYVFEPAGGGTETIYDSAYLSLKHLDTSNNRYDEANLRERFDKLERALGDYEALLASRSQPSSQ